MGRALAGPEHHYQATFDVTYRPGELIAVARANGRESGRCLRPVTEETFTGGTHTTYDGRALAVVRPTGAGPITVTVTAEGCATASVTVRAVGA